MGILSQPAIDSAVSWDEADLLTEVASGKDVLELGCDYGFSAVVMGRVARHVDTVDTFEPWQRLSSSNHEAREKVARLHIRQYGVADRVTVHKGQFGEVVPGLLAQGQAWDLVFVDGKHDYENVQSDAEVAWRAVRAGGALAFHDYGRFEVARAVEEFAEAHALVWRDLVRSLVVFNVVTK